MLKKKKKWLEKHNPFSWIRIRMYKKSDPDPHFYSASLQYSRRSTTPAHN